MCFKEAARIFSRGNRMKKDFIEKQKKKLLEQREALLASISGRNEEVSKIATDNEPGDEVDQASSRIDGSLLNQLGEQDANRLNQINDALLRIKQNQYGICLECGQPIPEPRLDYIPYAAYCVNCQSKRERMN